MESASVQQMFRNWFTFQNAQEFYSQFAETFRLIYEMLPVDQAPN